jgi:hypothetical protein
VSIKISSIGETISLVALKAFAREAKINTYASDGGQVPRSRIWVPGNNEHEYSNGIFYYRDSYCGFLSAPGRELIKTLGPSGKSVWSMSYDGGMDWPFMKLDEPSGTFARYVFRFLKLALENPSPELPARGPEHFTHEDFPDLVYNCHTTGNFERFRGIESIQYSKKKDANEPKRHKAFQQAFAGGIIMYK